MNKVEETRLVTAIAQIITIARANNSTCFVCDLVEVMDLSSLNLPRKRVFNEIGEIFAHSDFCKTYGYWTIAEIEGLVVQFAVESPDAIVRQDDGTLALKQHLGQQHYSKWNGDLQRITTGN